MCCALGDSLGWPVAGSVGFGRSSNSRNPCGSDFAAASMSASGIPSSRSFSGRKPSRGLGLRSFGSNIRRSTKVPPGFRYAGQCVLLMVTTRSYMVSPPDAVAAFPSAEAVVGTIGQIEVHGVASRLTVEVVEDQARAVQRGLDPGL